MDTRRVKRATCRNARRHARRTVRRAALVALGLLVGAASPAVWALQRVVRSQVANHLEAPLRLSGARMRLVEHASNPTHIALMAMDQGRGFGTPIARNGVRYLNRRNQEIPLYVLEGDLEVKNHTKKEASFVQVTAVFFDAFHNSLGDDRQTINQSLGPLQTTHLRWSKPLPAQDVFEVFFVITAARFDDNMTWRAPDEELVLVP